MSVEPAVEEGTIEPDDLVPARRTSAPADHVEVIPLDAAEIRVVAQASGPLYSSWQRYWQTLDPSERDPLSHPAWVAGHLEGQLRSRTAAATSVLVTFAGGEALTLLPVAAPQHGALAHARGFDAKSWALARSDHRAAFDSLFSTRFAGGRVRSLHLQSVDATNVLLETDRPHVQGPSWFRSLIELHEGYDAMLARLTSSNRSGVRRLIKKISRKHEVDLETLTTMEQLDGGFERFLQVDDRSWKQARGSTLRDDARQRESLRSALHHMALDGRAVIQFLRADGNDIAAQLCALIDHQLLVAKCSYDADWSCFGAGKLLLTECMRTWCPDHDIDGVNLVTGLDWHLRWMPRRIQTNSLWVFAPGLRGRFAQLHDVPVLQNAKAIVRGLGIEEPVRKLLRRA